MWRPAIRLVAEDSRKGIGWRMGTISLTAGPTKDWGWDTVYVFGGRSQEYVETVIPLRQWSPDGALPDTGTYTVRSYFNQREGAPAKFRIVP